MATVGTNSSRFESVPDCAAAVEEVLRLWAVGAAPAVTTPWLPTTKRATDATEVSLVFWFFQLVRKILNDSTFFKQMQTGDPDY